MRSRTTGHRLNTMKKDVISKLRSGYWGFGPEDVKKGARLGGGGAYEIMKNYCEQEYGHRPGTGTIKECTDVAKTVRRGRRRRTFEDLERAFRRPATVEVPRRRLEEIRDILNVLLDT